MQVAHKGGEKSASFSNGDCIGLNFELLVDTHVPMEPALLEQAIAEEFDWDEDNVHVDTVTNDGGVYTQPLRDEREATIDGTYVTTAGE